MAYKIEWDNEVDSATSPLEAAVWAFEGIENQESLMFTVTDLSTGKRYSVDLGESDKDAVIELKD